MQKKHLIVLALCTEMITMCKPNVPSYIGSRLISTADVPTGWTVQRENFTNNWGGKGYVIGFEYGNNLEDAGIGQQVIFYSDEASAINGFNEYNKVFTEIWKKPGEANFIPSNPKDLVEYKCVYLKTNGKLTQDCLILQQHFNYLSAVDVTMGEPFLNFEKLNSILKTIDDKLNE